MHAHAITFRRLSPTQLSVLAFLVAACATGQDPSPSGDDEGSGSPTVHAGSGSGGSSTSGAGAHSLPTAGTTVVGSGGSTTSTAGGVGGSSSSGAPPVSSGAPSTGGTAVATGGSAAATGGTASTCPPYTGALAKDSAIFTGGFGKSKTGDWSGYGYAYKYGTAMVSPGMGSGCFAAAKFCANGSVPADDKSGAGLGWNISQMMNASTRAKVAIATPVTLTFAGVTAGMRVQLSASAAVSYCYAFTDADIAAGTVTIALASFQTECWGTTGKAYDGVVPIEAIQIAVPGSMTGAANTFDFCLLDVEPG